jgi:hypothetical protein
VRKLREDAAETHYIASGRVLEQAREKTAACIKALEEYVKWRQEEEERRYRAIMNTEMEMKEMDDFKAGLNALRNRDTVLAEEVAAARKAEEDALAARELARENLRRARKDTEKISEHKKIWLVEESREAERLEELEMEEFSKKKSDEAK